MNIEFRVGAIFELILRDSHGNIKDRTNPFHNLVLDSGLDRMGSGAWITGVAVGSSNEVPSPAQTSLGNVVAWSGTVQTSSSLTLQTTTAPYYWSWKITYRFAQGAAAGNLSEIGVGWGQNNMWNRTLIKDLNGDPTTITVLVDEILDVSVEVRIYPPMADSVGVVELLDEADNPVQEITTTVRSYMGGADPFKPVIQPAEAVSFWGGVNMRAMLASGDMGAGMFTQPASIINGNLQNIVTRPYVSGSNKIVGYQHSGINENNGTHRSLLMSSRLCFFKFEYDPPIVKNNTQTMRHNFELSWGRYVPPSP